LILALACVARLAESTAGIGAALRALASTKIQSDATHASISTVSSTQFLEMRADVLPHLVMPTGPFVATFWAPVVQMSWDIASIVFYFSMAAGIYLNARLVSPRVPESGGIGPQPLSFPGRPKIPYRTHNYCGTYGKSAAGQ
jgi:hypothetical protein